MPQQEPSERAPRAPASVRPYDLRGRVFTALVLRPEGAGADEAFYAALDEQLAQTPQFFAEAPVILDMEAVADMATLPTIVAALKARKLNPFGVQNAGPVQRKLAEAAGLIPIVTGNEAPLRAQAPARQAAAPAPAPAPAPASKIVTSPVRSGQMVVAEEGDLIVLGPVGSGAELIAAGSIHVYGPLRGRAMAGAYGNEAARIFCRSLNAELLAIGGFYRTNETLEPELRGRAVQVFLDEKRLRLEALA
ncbi:septum site-determining protein MinC [Solirhodobacter olei]|uniref:septum site-determining protein MinC n=1 Tax=Solirhodobacter olei TaxID=2493082 RepID=UPI000FD9D1D4|nr:septum site-determining protein MinC [Solirhodobacter olei]